MTEEANPKFIELQSFHAALTNDSQLRQVWLKRIQGAKDNPTDAYSILDILQTYMEQYPLSKHSLAEDSYVKTT